MNNPSYTTSAQKKNPAFILAVDADYFANQLVHRDGMTATAFNQPINIYPHELFLQEVQSHLAIREREYLDNGVTTHEGRRGDDGKFKKGDPRYKQILPYLVARQEQEDGSLLYYPYRRTSGVGESRLAGNGSIGYGGHIDLVDVIFSKGSVIQLLETIMFSLIRESDEEFTVYDAADEKVKIDPSWFGFGNLFILDNSNAVGELHVGVIMHLDIPKGYRLAATEDELAKLPPMTAEQMLADPEFKAENWTKIYLEFYQKVNRIFGRKLERVTGMLHIDHGGESVGVVETGTFSAMDLQALETGAADIDNFIGSGFDGDDVGDIVTDESGLEKEQTGPYSEDDIPGSEIDNDDMGDKIPYSHYAPADIQDLPLREIASIEISEFVDMDAANLLAFRDDHVLAMTDAQFTAFRTRMIGQVNGANWVRRPLSQDEKSKLVKRLDETARLNEADFSNKVREAKTPTNESEAQIYGRGGQFAPEGTPVHLAEIQNKAATVYHHQVTEATIKKAELLQRVDAAQDTMATNETPYPPLSVQQADQIAKDVTGEPDATFADITADKSVLDLSLPDGNLTSKSLRALSARINDPRRTKQLDAMAQIIEFSEKMVGARTGVQMFVSRPDALSGRTLVTLSLPDNTEPQPVIEAVLHAAAVVLGKTAGEIPQSWDDVKGK